MYIIEQAFLLLGGITLFLLGLKYMSENTEKMAGKKMKRILQGVTRNKFLGVMTGTCVTAAVQSGIATNIIVIGFVNQEALTFYQASAVIMGANIGTTITAQLVSLSGNSAFDITAFGSLLAFAGFIFSFFKNEKLKCVGNIMIGFGMLFVGLEIMSDSISCFKGFEWFRNIFLVDNPLVLLLNGLFITAIIQSSSAITSIMIVLATNGLLSFENSMFIILGANIGTCLAVIIASLNKNLGARRAAAFNLYFNVAGSLLFFIPLILFTKDISGAFMSFSGNLEREIANFHTLFNIAVTLIILPFLKPFTRFIELTVNDKESKKDKNQKNQRFAAK